MVSLTPGLADAVARFQMRIHHQPGIGMAGQIGIGGLRHTLDGRQRQVDDQRRAGLAMGADHHLGRGHAIIVAGLEGEFDGITFGAPTAAR